MKGKRNLGGMKEGIKHTRKEGNKEEKNNE
jgi:hypothetical protein